MKKLMMIALGAGMILGGCSSDEPSGTTPAAPPTIELSAAQSRAAADMEAFDRPYLAFIRLKQTGICVAAAKVTIPSCKQRDHDMIYGTWEK